MANECIPFYEPGGNVTGHASAAVTGKRCLKVSGDRTDGNIAVAHADAGGRIFGVADADAAQGKKVGVVRGPGFIVPIRAEAAVDAFEEVEVGTNGQVVPLDAGVPIGFAVTAALINTDAQIALYDGGGSVPPAA